MRLAKAECVAQHVAYYHSPKTCMRKDWIFEEMPATEPEIVWAVKKFLLAWHRGQTTVLLKYNWATGWGCIGIFSRHWKTEVQLSNNTRRFYLVGWQIFLMFKTKNTRVKFEMLEKRLAASIMLLARKTQRTLTTYHLCMLSSMPVIVIRVCDWRRSFLAAERSVLVFYLLSGICGLAVGRPMPEAVLAAFPRLADSSFVADRWLPHLVDMNSRRLDLRYNRGLQTPVQSLSFQSYLFNQIYGVRVSAKKIAWYLDLRARISESKAWPLVCPRGSHRRRPRITISRNNLAALELA